MSACRAIATLAFAGIDRFPPRRIERDAPLIFRAKCSRRRPRAAALAIDNRWNERIGPELVKKAETAISPR